MARVSALNAIYLNKHGKTKEAIQMSLVPVSVGQKIQNSYGFHVLYLVAIGMKGNGLRAFLDIIKKNQFTRDESNEYISQLDQFFANEEGLINAYKMEYQSLLDTFKSISSESADTVKRKFGGILNEEEMDIIKNSGFYYYRPNETTNLFTNNARRQIENVTKPCKDVKPSDIPKLASKNSVKAYVTENVIGKILHDIYALSFTEPIIKKCDEDLLIAAAQFILALRSFEKESGQLPDRLEMLIPEYFSAIPLDPYDSQPMKYSKEDRLMYSVGGGAFRFPSP